MSCREQLDAFASTHSKAGLALARIREMSLSRACPPAEMTHARIPHSVNATTYSFLRRRSKHSGSLKAETQVIYDLRKSWLLHVTEHYV